MGGLWFDSLGFWLIFSLPYLFLKCEDADLLLTRALSMDNEHWALLKHVSVAFMMVCLSVHCQFAIACGFSGCFKPVNHSLLAPVSLRAVSAELLCNGYLSSVFGKWCTLLQMGMTFYYMCSSSWSMPQLYWGKAAWHAPGARKISNPGAPWGH